MSAKSDATARQQLRLLRWSVIPVLLKPRQQSRLLWQPLVRLRHSSPGQASRKAFLRARSAVGDMSSVSDEYIKNLKLVLENNPSAKIEVTGHTDKTGTDWFNNKLGLQRAEFVRSYLVNAGINADQIVTVSKGSSEPAEPNSTSEGRAANRRTEIKVII